ncbi:MAG TPA: hypothetical protein VLL77_04030, partial [Anaerolineales bacterium]|nr:hypothetical protein [Anaerolineales bacterium]
MFEAELRSVEQQILQRLEAAGTPPPGTLAFAPIPYAGQWGVGSPICFQAAAAEAKAGRPGRVPARAAELAERVA